MTPETYNGKPCAHGHTLRYRSNRKCVQCSRLEVRYIAVDCNGAGGMLRDTEAEARSDAKSIWKDGTIWRATRVKDSVHS